MTHARPERTMRAAIIEAPGKIKVGDRPYPVVVEPTDAVVRVALTCVCGGDLWQYRGESPFEPGPIGHEFVGVVEDVGSDVRGIATGDLIIAPTAYSDGTCPNCRAGIANACIAGGFWAVGGIDGGQGEAVRVPFADTTLVRVPGSGHSEATTRSLLALSDVMGTGHHAAVSAGVKPGSVVAVIGDGAVGLCAVLAARRQGARRIIALSRNPARQALAGSFGATDVVAERGDAATEAVLELTDRSASTPPSNASGRPSRSRRRWR
jgi:threonine dehydrogenase-like Zn-dependent dehydrogenase